jgi:cellulose synthase operon protein C
MSRKLSSNSLVVILAACFALSGTANSFADEDLLAKSGVAYERLQQGRYAEAEEDYRELLEAKPKLARAVVCMTRAMERQGKYDEALKAVQEFVKANPENSEALGRAAELYFVRGNLTEATKAADAAIKFDTDNAVARLVQAELLVETGQIKQADTAYRWFVRYYNRKQPEDAESLMIVAQGALQYARWHSSSSIFNFVINTLCPDAIKTDKRSWEAHYMSGTVLLEKYNRAQALPDLKKALTVNPRAIEALIALSDAALQRHNLKDADMYADQALEVQGNSVPALHKKIDVHMKKGENKQALELLQKALKVNAIDQGTLARIAALYFLSDVKAGAVDDEKRIKNLFANLDAIDDAAPEKPTRLEQLIIDLAKRNPKPGYFLTIFAEKLEGRRKFEMAEKSYQHATRVMPQLSEPKTGLGMLYMQIGRTDEAKQILDDAFKADPYHVRVSNMRKVLNVLSKYETIATDHFVIRVDSKADKILGEYMAEYLEEIYGDLVKLYGYEPERRTTFEIYHNAKGLSGHQWFSARMIGLPWIQTIGASTGMMVALASPTASEKPYNWARVVKHEFVHILTLQQTRFNIPHWFTEALAVTSEETPRPAVWNRLLLERVPADQLWRLDELNDVFVRPKTPLDWQFAYCQSRLYAQFMIEKHGEETIAKLLAAYRSNIKTDDAIQQVFKMSADEFHAAYKKFIVTMLEKELAGTKLESPKTLAELEKAKEANPDNAAAIAAYAEGLLKAKRRQQARELAEDALDINDKEPTAAVVLAELEILGRDLDEAAFYLEGALDKEKPNRKVLGLLAKTRLMLGEFEVAAELYELGRDKLGIGKSFLPGTDEWLKGLAAAYVKLGRVEELQEVLEAVAHLEGDNMLVRKKLAQLAIGAEDFKSAKKWASQAIYIDVMDADIHEILAKVYKAEGDEKKAAREERVAKTIRDADAEGEE